MCKKYPVYQFEKHKGYGTKNIKYIGVLRKYEIYPNL
jgi:ribonuclease HII